MKLKNELPEMIRRFSGIVDKLEPYAVELYASGDYIDFTTRLAWDVLRACYGTKGIGVLYNTYECTDKHITTAAKAALLAVFPAAANMEAKK